MGWEKDWVKYEEKFRKLYPTRSKRKYKGSDCEGYHTNSKGFVDHYSKVFAKEGLTNIIFIITKA